MKRIPPADMRPDERSRAIVPTCLRPSLKNPRGAYYRCGRIAKVWTPYKEPQ